MDEIRSWKHVFKLDPNKAIADEDLAKVCESGTDAVIVGGTDDVTLDDTLYLLSRIRRFSVSCALEVSNPEALSPGFDYYFIPSVLNSRKVDWVIGHHHRAVQEWADLMDWEEIVTEGYCIVNADSKAAQHTDAETNLSPEAIRSYALIADRLFRLPIFYLEYSGAYGDPDVVRLVGESLSEAQFFYGGGICDRRKAEEMAQYADTIVVGNAIYDDLKKALQTVKAVKSQR
ncbi:MAG TPA: heptaprenylglyceryl phosphate synthase [Bacillales bacterium]|nr:heptaprenylglyceryl phosphate synthase [Bacillales bacterium]